MEIDEVYNKESWDRMKRRTSKEGLHLYTSDPASRPVPEDQALHGDHAPAIDEHLQLAVRPPDVVQSHALGDDGTPTRDELERPPADGGAVGRVAGRRWGGAEGLVGGKRGREVGVQLTVAVGAPHESGGETGVGAPPAGAVDRLGRAVAAVCVCGGGDDLGKKVGMAGLGIGIRTEAWEFSTDVELESGLEEDGVGEGRFSRCGQVDAGRAGGVEGETAEGRLECDGAAGEVGAQGSPAVGGFDVLRGEIGEHFDWPEGAIGEGRMEVGGGAGRGGP